MKRFDIIKTIQLLLVILLAAAALLVIFRDQELYAMIADNPSVRLLAILLWLVLGLSFLFLLYDFNSYAGMKRENIELDNALFSDALTGIANRYSVDVYIGQYLNQPLPENMGCITLELTSLAAINEQKGHAGGDQAIQTFSEILQNASQDGFFIGRNGGNKFLAIIRECTAQKIDRFLEEVSLKVTEEAPEIEYSAGYAFHKDKDVQSLSELVALSDHRAYQSRTE